MEELGPAAKAIVESICRESNELARLGVRVERIGGEIRARNNGGRPKIPESEYGRLARELEKFQERTGNCSIEAFWRDVEKRNKALEARGFAPLFTMRLKNPRLRQNAIKRGNKELAALRE